MRVAVATESKYEFIQFRKALKQKYILTHIDEKIDGKMRIGIYTTRDSEFVAIMKLFKIIENITGINPYLCQEKHNRSHRRSHIIAAVIMKNRFGWNYSNIAKLFGYKDHASISEGVKKIKVNGIKSIPIELAVRRVMANYNNKNVSIKNS